MEGGSCDPIVIRQHFLICLVFLFIASAQADNCYDSYNKSGGKFDWFEFEKSLDGELFHNAHRMDKDSFYQLLGDIMPVLRKKHVRHDRIRMPHSCMLSMTLSFLGGGRICDQRVLDRPIKKKQ